MSTPTLNNASSRGHPHAAFHQSNAPIRRTTSHDDAIPPVGVAHGLGKAILSTAVFRCYHFILFFTIEAVIITYIHQSKIAKLSIQSTLMNVLGTVLGFVISYRSSSAFERYNEGRKYWSQIVHNIRMFSRTVWFNIPDEPCGKMELGAAKTIAEYRARTLVEKKTVLNLLLAYAVALKHYLRGEDGCHYQDLYHLIKFLPAYALPTGITVEALPAKHVKHNKRREQKREKEQSNQSPSTDALPLPATAATLRNRTASSFNAEKNQSNEYTSSPPGEVIRLLPARNPPGYYIFDFWPMSLFVRSLQKRGKVVKGRKALRDRAMNHHSGNVPLEITLYLSSYVASMMQRGAEAPVTGQMTTAVGQLVDALTGLERILQTPIPFSYAVHLWTVTLVWLVALPFQILDTLGWLTIPGVALAAFVYCGLMKCAEELENPFGYDLNDLNLDHFTHNIIRQELKALTALPMPDPTTWAFSPDNDAVFDNDGYPIYVDCPEEEGHDVASPTEWVRRGEKDIRAALGGSSNSHTSHAHGSSNRAGAVAAGAIAGAQSGAPAYEVTSSTSAGVDGQ